MQIVSVLGLRLVLSLGIVSRCGPWATRVLFIYLFLVSEKLHSQLRLFHEMKNNAWAVWGPPEACRPWARASGPIG